jgi:hypothetical protein
MVQLLVVYYSEDKLVSVSGLLYPEVADFVKEHSGQCGVALM